MTLGPQNRAETRGTINTDQPNDQNISNRTARTPEIHRQTLRKGNHPKVEEPTHRLLLLYQKEEREAATSTRL
jgi:hypothetical protein